MYCTTIYIGILELPSVDDKETLPNPLEHPPDDAEVGADLRAAATSRQEAPTGIYVNGINSCAIMCVY